MPFGRSTALAPGSRNGARRRLDPVLQPRQAADVVEADLALLVAQRGRPAERLVLDREHAPHVVGVDRAVVAQCLPHQAAHVVLLHAEQMHDQHVERVAVAARLLAGLLLVPLGLGHHDRADLVAVRQLRAEVGRQPQDLGRQLIEARADEHQRARRPEVRQRDLADQPHRHRILEARVRVAQHVHAVLLRLVDVLQRVEQVVGLVDRFVAAMAADAAGDAPRHQHLVLQVAGLVQQLEYAGLLVRLDQHDREARAQQRAQLGDFVTVRSFRVPPPASGSARPGRAPAPPAARCARRSATRS